MLRKLRVSRQHGESVERQTIPPDESCFDVAYGILGMCSAVMADMLMEWLRWEDRNFEERSGAAGLLPTTTL